MNLYSHNMVRILQYTYYMHGSLYLNVSQKCLGFCTPKKTLKGWYSKCKVQSCAENTKI